MIKKTIKYLIPDFLGERKFSILYIVLCIHWLLFFQFGKIDYLSYDWYCIHQWLDVTKVSLDQGKIPYEAQLWHPGSPGSELFGKRYFAIPFLIISPQFILLKWISINVFIQIQVLLNFSVGYYFLVKWSKKLQLQRLTTYFLIIAWSLNGALADRMAVGHIQLAGYFLIPGFIYLLYNLLEASKPGSTKEGIIKYSIPFSLYLFLVLTQGSVFVVYQMVVVLMVAGLFFFRKVKFIIFSLIVFCILASYFIYPNILFGEFAANTEKLRIVYGGYSADALFGFVEQHYHSSLPVFIDSAFHTLYSWSKNIFLQVPLNLLFAFVHILFALIVPFYPYQDASWEYSLFIGPVGCLILFTGLYHFCKQLKKKQFLYYKREILLIAFISMLSIWVFSRVLFGLLQKIIAINAIDRIPTRLFLYPLFAFLLISCVGLDKSGLTKRIQTNKYLLILLIGAFSIPVLYNSYSWIPDKVSSGSLISENTVRGSKPVFDTLILQSNNHAYVQTVNISLMVSFLSLMIVSGLYFYLKPKITRSENASR